MSRPIYIANDGQWGAETERLLAPLSAKRKANRPTDIDVRHAQIDRALRERELAIRSKVKDDEHRN